VLSIFRWKILLEQCTFKINPPPAICRTLPLISSSQKAGDLISEEKERKGDPFDLKPYHPSDGIKKILWKIYAKTGELISRHPEASMTPEGQVVSYIVADSHDDLVCSYALSYFEKLEELNLDIFTGCEGMGSDATACSHDSARELFVNCVWNSEKVSDSDTATELHGLIQSATNNQSSVFLQKVIIFCSSGRLQTEEGMRRVTSVAEILDRQGIKPVIFVIEQQLSGRSPASGTGYKFFKSLAATLIEMDESQTIEEPGFYIDFMNICLNKSWQVAIQK